MSKKDYSNEWKNLETRNASAPTTPVQMVDQRIVINDSDKLAVIQILNAATGRTDEVFIQPMSRAKLPPGYAVTARSKSKHPRLIENTVTL